MLSELSRDGILTCHEDVLMTETYVYTFEPEQSPGHFSHRLRDVLGQYFPIANDGDIDDCPVKDGVIFNHYDSSFESFLVREVPQLVAAVKRRDRCHWINASKRIRK